MGRPLNDLTFEGRPAYVFDDPVPMKEEDAPPRPAEAIGRLYDKRVYRVCALKSLLSAAGESAGVRAAALERPRIAMIRISLSFSKNKSTDAPLPYIPYRCLSTI
jgi:hypothetical protein